MVGKAVVVFFGFLPIAATYAQQVEVPRTRSDSVVQQVNYTPVQPVEVHPPTPATSNSKESTITIEQMRRAGALAAQKVKEEIHDIEIDSSEPDGATSLAKKQISANGVRPTDRHAVAARQSREPESFSRSISFSSQTALTKLADGFDFPVGKPDARGYYKARGFQSHGHLGEDWDGVGGGNTDLGDPIYSIGDGIVVFARDCHQGWGNVVIIRHAYREGLGVHTIDSLYGHLDKILVRRGQRVTRGQQVGTMGTAHGLYDSHLHLEIRKNIAIGMSRDKFARDLINYYDPSDFIVAHRRVQSSGASYRVAMNTFIYDARIPWDKLRNYTHAHTGGGSSESAYALKKALAAQSAQ
jgi:murein DD-endopeptidase MepM/ murein hydrolase activator NlpD